MALSYEVALWGGLQKVNDKVETNKEILGRLLAIFIGRQKLEADVASGLSKVMRKWRYDEPEGPTFHVTLTSQKEHSEYVPVVHNEINQFVANDLIKPTDQMIKDVRNQQTKLLNDHSLLCKELKRKTDDLIKAKQEYFKLFQAHKEALALFNKSKTDPMFPAKQLSKLNSNAAKLEKQAADAHKAYQTTIVSFQKFQVSFESQMKGILRSFQELDEKCLSTMQNLLKIFLEKQLQGMQKIARYDQNITALASSLDVGDIMRYIESNVTGLKPEPLVEYEQYVSKVRPSQTSQPAAAAAAPGARQSLFARGDRHGSASSSGVTTFTRGSGTADPERAAGQLADDADPGTPDESSVSSSPGTPTSAGSRLANWRLSTQVERAASPSLSSSSVSSVALAPPVSPLPPASPTSAPPATVVPIPATQTQKASTPQGSKTAVAIFDYDAADANEIGFKIGDVITVINEHDSGWWTGECGGKVGMFPAPYVKLSGSETDNSAVAAAAPAVERRQCAFEFQATESNELSMAVNDVVEVISQHGDWYLVKNERGESGLIPGNYTQPYP